MFAPNSKTFCSSPWFHMRILQTGKLQYCRWQEDEKNSFHSSLTQEDFLPFFQKEMSNVRLKMLQGETVDACNQCHNMEQHNKVSGRERQLLKVGIQKQNFAKTFRSSTFYDKFIESANHNGDTDLWPQDWQIDLGNYCNSNCVFCSPEYSSKLAVEFKKLGFIEKLPTRNWSDDSEAVDRFVNLLSKSKKIAYLHFLGGETVITPGFKKILTKLIEKGLHKTTSIGFTTNLTVWDQEVVDLLSQYKEVNLGMSVECFHPINNYLRWPSRIDSVKSTMDKWIKIGKDHKWLIQFRITPTVFSIAHLITIYDFAYTHNIGVESCNFLQHPEFMRMSILPMDVREQISTVLEQWINNKDISQNKIINGRSPDLTKDFILQDVSSYINYLKNSPVETDKWPALVSYLKKLESSRGNSILDYAPEYEKLLQQSGY
jgi:molybdenum cofactor biosynthesis enzyme MoaA